MKSVLPALSVLIALSTAALAPAYVLAQTPSDAACHKAIHVTECSAPSRLDPIPTLLLIAERLADLRENYSPGVARHAISLGLAAQETAVGIRADQQNAWRAYTNAVLAMVPSKENLVRLLGDDKEDPKGPPAFGRLEAAADIMLERHEKAAALKKAIVELRAKLTPEQLEAARLPRLLADR